MDASSGANDIGRLIKTLINEIREREVLRVSALYAVGAWLILQIAEVTLEPLGFPPWMMRALIVAAVVGFPLVFFLAWVIRIEPEGLIFDLPLWKGESGERVERKTDLVVVAALTALLAIGAYTVGVRVFEGLPDNADIPAELGPPNSIAVLAFESDSADESDAFFSGGLAQEILSRLSSLHELNVAARSSSFQFSGEKYDVREVARALSVRNILEGSVQRQGRQLRVSVQLVDGGNGFNIWNKVYARTLDDIFAIQEEIAASVVNELQIALSVESEEQLQRQPTENVDAYVYYLQGLERLRSPQDQDALAAAVDLFTTATAMAPAFSRAYAGLCEAHLGIYSLFKNAGAFEAAERACDKAAELDPGLSSEIHVARGRLYRNRGWGDKAERELLTAISIAPTGVDAYIELGYVYLEHGRKDEAEAMMLRAVDLKNNYWRAHKALGDFYHRTERYREAVERSLILVSLTPDSPSAYSDLGAVYWILGEYDKAREAFDRSLELKPTRRGYTNMGLRYYYAGQFANAVNMQLEALELAPEDHRLWGRLAESYRFIPGLEAQSQQAYARAAELAEATLKINEHDWRTTGLRGLYLAHLGEADSALQLVDEAVSLAADEAEAHYYQALARLELGKVDGAIEALENAVGIDEQYRQFILSDPDLQSVSGNERFVRLVSASE